MVKIVWLDEEDAAKFIKRKPETLRKRAKSGAWNVTYREIAGRSFQYSLKLT